MFLMNWNESQILNGFINATEIKINLIYDVDT